MVFQSSGKSTAQIYWEVITKLNHKYGHELNIGEDRFPDFMDEYNQLSVHKFMFKTWFAL